MNYAFSKFAAWPLRLRHVIFWFPLRLKRLARHLLSFCLRLSWWVDLPFYILDLFGFPEVLECLQDILFWYQRPLRQAEYDILTDVFGPCLPYPRIRVDLRSHLGPRTHRMYYVQCCTINSWGNLPEDILVHEAVHIWQFAQEGSVYIPRALRAQATKFGYDYGGAAVIKKVALAEGLLTDFNHEQQADLIADYWRIKNGWQPRWGNGRKEDLAYYLYFVDQLCESSVP